MEFLRRLLIIANLALPSKCKNLGLGNAISWKEDLWHFNKAIVTEIEDSTTFCNHENQLVAFAQPETLSNANNWISLWCGS